MSSGVFSESTNTLTANVNNLSSNAISNLINILDKGYSGGSCRLIPPENKVIAIAQTILANKWPRFLGQMYTPYVFTTRKIFNKTGAWDENREIGEKKLSFREDY